MDCQWCEWGDLHPVSKRVPNEQGVYMHTGAHGEALTCENQPVKKIENPVTEAEKLRLYHMVDLASIIRMDHDVDIWTAIDWLKTDLLTHNTEGDPVHNVIERLLARNKHECTAACTSFRPEP